eukprot:NODE_581_length_1588_cov_9.128005_g477_i0.p1 GENE.NODE_581_length_1588_cov_9.128005_g477_i0~~NODE_581_length_1588_cov_9.128005_g477_i0.p1  ORF type:complete len:184 (-),score=29.42 NODE_581_length_1588_cov_9.128005_g477_i0:116-667(-)
MIMSAEFSSVALLAPHFHWLAPPPTTNTSVVRHFLTDTRATGVGRIYILANAMPMIALVLLPYMMLVKSAVILCFLNSLLFLTSFVYLRHCHPDVHRPIKVPCGLPGCIVLSTIPIVLLIINVYYVVMDKSTVVGTKHLHLYITFGVIMFGIAVHAVYKGAVAHQRNKPEKLLLMDTEQTFVQ